MYLQKNGDGQLNAEDHLRDDQALERVADEKDDQ